MCLVVLSIFTEEKQCFDELEEMLAGGNTLDYMVVQYFKAHIDKLLRLNEEIHNKKKKKNSDDNE